jgi:hypothetical protein
MPPPTIFVMSTGATGPRDDRQPTGVVHAAPSTHPPVNTTFCGIAGGLYWFGHVDYWTVTTGLRCEECIAIISERAAGDRGQEWTYGNVPPSGSDAVTPTAQAEPGEPPPP